MRILAIGDIHGRNVWKQIVHKETFDKVVFIGDYFDSFDIKPGKQLENFLDILEFKKKNSDKVELLIGNHDFHYMNVIYDRYSGYSNPVQINLVDRIDKLFNKGTLKFCYKHDNLLFSHAGFSKTWINNYEVDLSDIENSIDNLAKTNINAFGFQNSKFNSVNAYGDNIFQSPLWIRPRSLEKDKIDNFIQIVGHTHQSCISTSTINDNSIIYIDVFDTMNEYLIIDNGEFSVGDV